MHYATEFTSAQGNKPKKSKGNSNFYSRHHGIESSHARQLIFASIPNYFKDSKEYNE